MKKIYAFALAFIFIFSTILVLLFDSSVNKKIEVSFSEAEFKNSSKAFVNKKVNADLNAKKVKSTEISTNIQGTNLNNNDNIGLNNTKTSYVPAKINSQGQYYNDYSKFKQAQINYNNAPQNSHYINTFNINDTTLSQTDIEKIKQSGTIKDLAHLTQDDLKLIENILNQVEIEQQDDIYEDIDWSMYKSRIINKITDDSSYLQALDDYPIDTPLYYSFTVDNYGNIKNVSIVSLVVRDYDKKQFEQMIMTLEHKPILRFPKNTNRKKVNISSILLLSDELKHVEASEIKKIRDIERVKVSP